MESPPPTNQPTDLPVLQTVLRVDYEKCQSMAKWLKKHTHNYIIGQHDADAEITTTHCHILIQGLKVTRESLRKEIIKYAPGAGQNFTSAICHKSKKLYDEEFLAIYILKGETAVVKSSSYDDDRLRYFASKWINHKINKATVIQVLESKKKPNTKWQDCQEIIEGYLTNEDWYRIKTIPYVVLNLDARTRLVGYIIQWANSKAKAMNSYMVADYYDIIICNALPEYYTNQCAAIINNRHKYSH